MHAMPEQTPDLHSLQYRFTQHIRDPDSNPAPDDIEPRRMAIYNGLFYRNVENFMANSFPVLRKITPDNAWNAMIRDYFKHHVAHTPLFPKMPQEFLTYLEQERDLKNDPPFILELAQYEWAEMIVSLDNREIDMNGIQADGDLLQGIPVLNPVVLLLSYRYPVHTIGPDNIPDAEPDQPTYLAVYRDKAYKVGFLELNPVSARLLSLVKDNSKICGQKLLEQIAQELKHPDPHVVINGGLEIMEKMLGKDILLGIRQPS